MKTFHLLSVIALAAATLHGQPTNGPVYWSPVATPPDCTSLAGESPVAITSGTTTLGYSCWVSGTFVWLAAGGAWGSSIRVAAPASAAIGVDYTFYDTSGNNLALDTTLGSGNEMSFALHANQPAEVGLTGAANTNHSTTQTGSVYATFYCPDAATCANVLPQLLYSALPTIPWSLSVPISWDTELWTEWSAEGIDDGGTHRVSLVVFNENVTAASYTVQVWDSAGSLAGTGTTPSISAFGTYGALLSDVILTPLPPGVFKILVDGGSKYSAVEVLQFNGTSATALQVGYDSAPSLSASAAAVLRSNGRSARMASTPKPVFSGLAK
ncbi:MAG: hypothetical protein ABSH47_10350 [Bryobacteraceae bacterium]|jgi:hypothetical protein